MVDVVAYRHAILNHALRQFRLQAGETAFDLTPFLNALPQATGSAGSLHRILTALNGQRGIPQSRRLLDELEAFLLGDQHDDDAVQRLLADAAAILHTQDTAASLVFNRWLAVLRRALSGVPGQRGEPDVSLYHETKLLSAVVHATRGDPDGEMMLVAGDFPGIQAMIYAIDVKGAAKNVRGRSFFLQLLTDAVVQRLLADFDLPQSNALYVAGGKFLLLLPYDDTGLIDRLQVQMNQELLDQFKGTMRFVLVTESLALEELHTGVAFQAANARLRAKLGRAKMQPFSEMIAAGMDELFAPEYDDDIRRLADKEVSQFNQDVFAELANDLANRDRHTLRLTFSAQPIAGEKRYSRFLRDLCGTGCQIERADTPVSDGAYALRLNEFAFDPTREHGFRMLAAHTPLVSAEDVDYWQDTYASDDDEGRLYEGAIRPFELLADQGNKNSNFKRYGVLRMDVDNLGAIFAQKIGVGQQATVTETVVASDAMSLFFEAYLPQLCRELEDETRRPNSLYLIYGGGDDLFIVGEWDLLPELAALTHNRFTQYTNGQASISAGIVLNTARFPFYQAADLALEALDEQAKGYPNKNAISFFDQVIGWDEWPEIQRQQEHLHILAEAMNSNTIPRSVMDIYSQWRKQGDADDTIRFGRYMWLGLYALTRLKHQHSKHADAIDIVQTTMLKPETIRYAGTAALWAELRRRTRGKQKA